MLISSKTRIKILSFTLLLALIFLVGNFYFNRGSGSDTIPEITISDISTAPQVICDPSFNGNLWLLSYAHGDVHLANQRYQVVSALGKCIDFYLPYNISHINPEYVKTHYKILSQKRGAGYWMWKPYIILKTLEQIPENDIVLYLDSGQSMLRPIDSLVTQLGNYDIMLFKGMEGKWMNKFTIKRDLLKMMDLDNEEVRNSTQLQAGYILIKNSKFAREFIKIWMKWCENEKAITDIPSENEHREFVEHRHDQAILNLLYIRNKERILVKSFDEANMYFFSHRRTDINQSF